MRTCLFLLPLRSPFSSTFLQNAISSILLYPILDPPFVFPLPSTLGRSIPPSFHPHPHLLRSSLTTQLNPLLSTFFPPSPIQFTPLHSSSHTSSLWIHHAPLLTTLVISIGLVGFLSEFIQGTLPYRTFDWGDVGANVSLLPVSIGGSWWYWSLSSSVGSMGGEWRESRLVEQEEEEGRLLLAT